MDEMTRASLRNRLHAQRDELRQLSETGDDLAQTVELDQSRVGRLSRMDAMAGQAMSQESQRRRRVLLQQIERALSKMDQGDYGECEECLDPINPQRLALNPAAPLCIVCATAAET